MTDSRPNSIKSLIGGRTTLNARMYPNGEAVVWKAKSFKLKEPDKAPSRSHIDYMMGAFRLYQEAPEVLEAYASALGLVPQAIFDKLKKALPSEDPAIPCEVRVPKGRKGITPYGRRMVRNAVYLLEREAGESRCIFATVTVPALPIEQMEVLHSNWHKAVELYRLNIKRMLQDKQLAGEIVTVSEVQEKRYEKTGLPVLHLHSVFVGVTRTGHFAIETEQHDDAWFRALNSVVDIKRSQITTAGNLKRVKKSAAAYISKYLTKGAAAIARIIDDGFSRWLPKHWWNATRTLVTRVKQNTRRIDDFAEWLADGEQVSGGDVWEWHRDVVLSFGESDKITIARYGRLKEPLVQKITNFLRMK
jgi:hypothetical protein